MTQQRRDKTSTEFGIWLREQPEIDSGLCYTATNVDYLWTNYKSGYWMLIEEKRFGKLPAFYQVEMYKLLDNIKLIDKKYKGFHVLVFENTSPSDGGIYMDGKYINTDDLMQFLQFAKDDDWYQSWFPKRNVIGISFKNRTE